MSLIIPSRFLRLPERPVVAFLPQTDFLTAFRVLLACSFMLMPQLPRRLIKTIKEFGVRKTRSAFCLCRVVYGILDRNKYIGDVGQSARFPPMFQLGKACAQEVNVGCKPAGRRTLQFSGRVMNSLAVLCKKFSLSQYWAAMFGNSAFESRGFYY